jgi:hypothetical protein
MFRLGDAVQLTANIDVDGLAFGRGLRGIYEGDAQEWSAKAGDIGATVALVRFAGPYGGLYPIPYSILASREPPEVRPRRATLVATRRNAP